MLPVSPLTFLGNDHDLSFIILPSIQCGTRTPSGKSGIQATEIELHQIFMSLMLEAKKCVSRSNSIFDAPELLEIMVDAFLQAPYNSSASHVNLLMLSIKLWISWCPEDFLQILLLAMLFTCRADMYLNS